MRWSSAASLTGIGMGLPDKGGEVATEVSGKTRGQQARLAGREATERGGLDRHPGDFVRVFLAAVTLGVTSLIARGGRVGAYEHEVFHLVNKLPSLLTVPLVIIQQAGTFIAVCAAVLLALALRRIRLALDLAIGGGSAYLLAKGLKLLVARQRPAGVFENVVIRGAEQAGLGFPSGHVAVAAALVTVAAPYFPRSTRRALWALVGLIAVARMYVGAHLPIDVIGGAALGWLIGAAVHLVRGAPGNRPTVEGVRAALDAAGVQAVAVQPLSADARGSTPFIADLHDGTSAFVKVVSREQRDADLLFKLYRFLVFRTVEDESPFTTPKRAVEHEGYVSLLAERAGGRVPPMVVAAETADHSAILAQELVPAKGLDDLAADEFDDALLRRIWLQVALLHDHRIAHRDMRLANWMVDSDRQPWLIDFGFSEGSASMRRLAIDDAELLAATASQVGAKRAVAAAARVVDMNELVQAAGILQPFALSTVTRGQAKKHKGLLNEIKAEVATLAGAQLPPVDKIERILVRPRVWLGLLGAAFAIHLLLPQVGELDQTLRAIGNAKIDWLLLGVLGSAATYVMAALSLTGAVSQPLVFARTFLVQVAASFTSRIAPAGLGGVGLNERYLERTGVSRTAAVTAVSASSVAGFMVHMTLLTISAVALGLKGLGVPSLPDGWPLLITVIALVLAIATGVGLPWGRRRLVAPVMTGLREFVPLLRRPARAAALFGGSAGTTLAYILTLAASVRAFGGSTSIEHVAVSYLVGSALGSVAPVPGGLGVTEAALVAGLTSFGVQSGPAIAGVLSFRLLTFWLPIAPGIWVFRRLHRADVF